MSEAENKLNKMLQIKLHIGKMESDKEYHRRQWQKHNSKVKELAQNISICKDKIMEMIE